MSLILQKKKDFAKFAGACSGAGRAEAAMMIGGVTMHHSFDGKMEKQEKREVDKERSDDIGQLQDDLASINEKLAQLTQTIKDYTARIYKLEQQDDKTEKGPEALKYNVEGTMGCQ